MVKFSWPNSKLTGDVTRGAVLGCDKENARSAHALATTFFSHGLFHQFWLGSFLTRVAASAARDGKSEHHQVEQNCSKAQKIIGAGVFPHFGISSSSFNDSVWDVRPALYAVYNKV